MTDEELMALPMNERVRVLYQEEKWSPQQIAYKLNRTLGRICDIITLGFPESKRIYRATGDPGHVMAKHLKNLPADPNEYARLYKYGVTTKELRQAQNNLCPICGITLNKSAHVDHDHVSGRVRGLLCHHCNIMIAMARENPFILISAIKYLIHE